MTGTTSGGAPTKRAPAASTPRPAAPPTAGAVSAAGTPRTLSIQLPLVTITFGPQPAYPVPAPRPAQPVATATTGATLERLAFYGGVTAAGALGALEWPVAVAVAAGTWVAQHTLPGPRRPTDPAPADGTPGTDASAARDTGTPVPTAAGAGPAGRG